MKALGNFSCNKLAKKKGEVLSDEDLEVIGDQIQGLIASGLVEPDIGEEVELNAEPEFPAPEVETLGEQPEEKPKKGRKKKEA
jgi:hypothetical protein